MPTFLAVVVAVATALLTFGGVLLGHWLTSRGAVELDTWRRREETMRMLRWAVELSTAESRASVTAGFATLRALSESELLQTEDEQLVRDVSDALMTNLMEAYADDGDKHEEGVDGV
jgi:hypothetical protein